MTVSSRDDNSVVLDIFDGAGTTAVALQLGHRAITIGINEARYRLANAPPSFAVSDDGQVDDGPPNSRVSESAFSDVSNAALAAD